ncbi:MAG: hypothetical protein Q9210_002870, partial [Variospora velana]
VDYDKFVKMAEYAKRKTAVTILGGLIKHKISSSTVDSFSVANSAGNGTGSPKKRAAPKPKALTTDNQDDSSQGAVPKSTPKKRGSKGQGAESAGKRAKKSSVKVEEEEQRGEEADEGAEIVKQEGEGEEVGVFEAAVESNGDVEV